MSSKVRVVPSVPARGAFALSIAAGVAYGLVAGALVTLLEAQIETAARAAQAWQGAPAVIGMCALGWLPIPMILLWLMARLQGGTGGAWRVVLAGVGMGIGQVVGIFGLEIWNSPNLLVGWMVAPMTWKDAPRMPLLAVPIVLGVASMVGGAVAGVVLGLRRAFGRRVEVQNGTTCWRCGYDLGGVNLERCPECGRRFDMERRPRPILEGATRWLIERGRVVLICVGAVVAGMIGWTAASYVVPAMRFVRAMPTGWERRANAVISTYYYVSAPFGGVPVGSGPRGTPGIMHTSEPMCFAWWRPDGPVRDSGFVVQYVPRARPDEPSIYVSRGALNDAFVTRSLRLHAGSANISATLNGEQARWVIERHAIPDGLLEEIRAKGMFGGWTSARSTAWIEGRVDAAPYFPMEAK